MRDNKQKDIKSNSKTKKKEDLEKALRENLLRRKKKNNG